MTPGEQLQYHLTRYLALQQHRGDVIFMARLTRLRHLQAVRLRSTHADLFADTRLTQALEFMLTDIYGGQHLLAVVDDIRRALPLALKLLPAKVMATSACALEAALITQELDEALTLQLGETLDGDSSDNTLNAAYIAAYIALGCHDARQRQLQLIDELGGHLQRYIRSRLLQTTFKMVKRPALSAGFSALYNFMANCFSVMQPVPDVAWLLAELSGRETVIMQQLFAGVTTPFVLDRQAS